VCLARAVVRLQCDRDGLLGAAVVLEDIGDVADVAPELRLVADLQGCTPAVLEEA
jgi:hypothetical protein